MSRAYAERNRRFVLELDSSSKRARFEFDARLGLHPDRIIIHVEHSLNGADFTENSHSATWEKTLYALTRTYTIDALTFLTEDRLTDF